MKLAVMGSGAIGGYLGARLASVGAQVTFVARGAHLAAIRAQGLAVQSPLGDLRIAPAAATDAPATVGVVDLVLLGTKLYDVEAAAATLAPMVGPETAIVCLQNGIDAGEIVARRYGSHHVLGAVVMINGEITAPGVIRHNALNRLTVGELDGTASARLARLVTLATRAGIETVSSPDIRLEIWRKFLLLAPMAALSAMTRVPLARIHAHPETWGLAEEGMREVVLVARTQGVALGEEDVQRTMAFVRSMPATWRASLTVDLEQGRRLEIDWLAGAVVRIGEAAGLQTPFHRVALGVLKPHAAGGS
jgi:2-dehydropantoate 2-reductase